MREVEWKSAFSEAGVLFVTERLEIEQNFTQKTTAILKIIDKRSGLEIILQD